jgi:hypothetical protein
VKSILMVTGSHDLTCDYLQQRYQSHRFFRFNIDKFSDYAVSVTPFGFKIETSSDCISTGDCGAIYYRKPLLENLHKVFEEKYHGFSHKEVLSLVEGIVDSFPGICLSRPYILRRANNKIVQMGLAKKVGFVLPSSVISNSTKLITDANIGYSIVKPLAIGIVDQDGQREFVQTNIVDQAITTEALKYVPAYFQQYILKEYELRVTFVGDKAYAIRIDSENKVDWRKHDNRILYTLCDLPSDIYNKCREFMRELDMDFGCFDFMYRDRTYYFLEMNANGQWAWLDGIAELKISESIIQYLSDEEHSL